MAVATAPKTREGAPLKARRYLTDGRVSILRAAPGHVRALVRGDGAFYECGYRDGRWFCACRARTDQCSHLLAVRLCTAPDYDG